MCEEGVLVLCPRVFGEATFVGNGMLSYGGATSYNAVLGRTLAQPPVLNWPSDANGSQARGSHRLRAFLVQAIIGVATQDLVNRAPRFITRHSGEQCRSRSGGSVEYVRDPSTKEAP